MAAVTTMKTVPQDTASVTGGRDTEPARPVRTQQRARVLAVVAVQAPEHEHQVPRRGGRQLCEHGKNQLERQRVLEHWTPLHGWRWEKQLGVTGRLSFEVGDVRIAARLPQQARHTECQQSATTGYAVESAPRP